MFQNLKSPVSQHMIRKLQKQSVLENTAAQCSLITASLLPDPHTDCCDLTGDYVMVHAGVAIAKITDEDEDETDQLMEELL